MGLCGLFGVLIVSWVQCFAWGWGLFTGGCGSMDIWGLGCLTGLWVYGF